MPASNDSCAPSRRRVAWSRWLLVAMATTVALYLIDLLVHPLPSDASTLFQKFASSAVFFGSAVLCALKGRRLGRDGSAWWLFALAMLLWGAASGYYSIVLWDRAVVPIPSIADGFWIAFYIPAYLALYRLLKQRVGSFTRNAWLDALVGGLGVGGAVAATVLAEVLTDTSGTPAAVATDLAYPVGDLGLLAMVAAAITVAGWRKSGSWRWIAPAFGLFAVADSTYLVTVANGTYAVGGIIDIGWPMAALLVGTAAFRREAAVRVRSRSTGSLMLPAISGFAALVLLVSDHFHRTNPLALTLAAVSILLILVRLHLTARDNAQLLSAARREATTDALTGLGNRRQLMADLAVHVDRLDVERPLMLTLFDLDGFKQYNDTFGHMAGDGLLQRLAGRLVGTGSGSAYRMGGDEFCTLERRTGGPEVGFGTAAAAAALSEHGGGFSIGCSHGAVLLPDDTADPTDALRMADRRMYSHKERGRTSPKEPSSDALLRALAERDPHLSAHLGAVAELAAATAQCLDASAQDQQAARQTALLHGVGKIAIPDEILKKPGPLSAAEWAYMKRHTIVAERIISAAPGLARVATFARSTHEHYDGRGYPDGLSGDAIPLVARIVSVCNAYDAMTEPRAYRKARSSTAALAELRACAGTQFDPHVVDAYEQALAAESESKRELVMSR